MTVTLCPGSRKFEVTSGDSLVVSGQYSLDDAAPTAHHECGEREDVVDQITLKPDGIYKVQTLISFLNCVINASGRVPHDPR